MAGRIAVVSAFEPELAPLRRVLIEGPSAELDPSAVVTYAVGIGLVAAAIGTTRLLEERLPSALVFIGTCGAYPGASLVIGDVVVSSRARLVDAAVLDGRAELPGPIARAFDADVSLVSSLAGGRVRAVDVATTLAVTVDDRAALDVEQKTGAAVEHLEAYAVAAACVARDVPFAAVLGVANRVGSRGRVEWRENHERASTACAEHMLAWLSSPRSREVG